MDETITSEKLRDIIWPPIERLAFSYAEQGIGSVMISNARAVPLFFVFAGLFGIAGVALAALAAHGGGEAALAASASAMCLAHAPALLALAIGIEKIKTARLAGLLMILGTTLFAGDLVIAALCRLGPFPLCRANRRLGDDARLAGGRRGWFHARLDAVRAAAH